ncbi:hypothetical protein CAOG_08543 [Capsaspora owczarzaki ATCC 30864]|uniref:F-box domain-containing protein n=1 Tax=Capsaspora owczarzaki (strain ATCC 30864) TaxID=595528 RepID=A0A0D2VK68_CAPO3|nr:hypothetical protein CAOG_08543 [Capsaspora owczarzaki ATCC 30864]KJE90412.1 hypothetical protein CAOG_008543 [Capsaspora owczarzaki ATCC 30864]|eukprot:XP_011270125.1 hypothetical protein CAOG_08543 [Capsaspora owczarzaki ATCC 30864]
MCDTAKKSASHLYLQAEARPSRSGSDVLPVTKSSSIYTLLDVQAGPLIHEKLPPEVMLLIFSHMDVVSLCRCAQVSKYWNFLALDGSLWQNIDFFAFQKHVQDSHIEHIARRCGNFLRRLSLYGCENVYDKAIRVFARHCHNIEDLNLSQCTALTDFTVQAISVECHAIKRLSLANCTQITDLMFPFLARGCPELEELDVSWCSMMGRFGLKLYATDTGSQFGAHFTTRLRFLRLKGCSRITDAGLDVLAAACPELRGIDLTACICVGDVGIRSLARHCPKLERLCISHCPLISNAALKCLGEACPDLLSLECAGCVRVTDAGVEAIAKHCPRLECLDLEDCIRLTDQSLRDIGRHNRRLARIILSNCDLLTDDGIRLLANGCPYLDTVELDNCSLLTDTALDHLRVCKWLSSVQIYDCRLVSREGVQAFLKHLKEDRERTVFDLLYHQSEEHQAEVLEILLSRQRKTSLCRSFSTTPPASPLGRVRVHSFLLPLPGAAATDHDNNNENQQRADRQANHAQHEGFHVGARAAHVIMLARAFLRRPRSTSATATAATTLANAVPLTVAGPGARGPAAGAAEEAGVIVAPPQTPPPAWRSTRMLEEMDEMDAFASIDHRNGCNIL